VVPEPGVAAQLLALTNQARTSAGLRSLGASSTLSSIAAAWSAHMASTHQLGHNPDLAGEVSGWAMIGENAAMAWSASQAQSVLMGDAAHRANILQPRYNRVGVGVARAADGSMWFTVDFMQTAGYSAPSKPTPAPTHHATPKPVVHALAARSWPLANRTAAASRASRSLARGPVPSLAKPAHVVLVPAIVPEAAGRRAERVARRADPARAEPGDRRRRPVVRPRLDRPPARRDDAGAGRRCAQRSLFSLVTTISATRKMAKVVMPIVSGAGVDRG
jgi:hypothetical protein